MHWFVFVFAFYINIPDAMNENLFSIRNGLIFSFFLAILFFFIRMKNFIEIHINIINVIKFFSDIFILENSNITKPI